jgi:oligopeptide/dipeptide ABC transporter ATP-binding protein
MGQGNELLQIKGLKTHFYTDKGIVPAVDGVSININKGQVVGLVGESGCGKSITALSVLRLISNTGKIVEGEIIFENRNLLKLNKKEICSIRGNEISMIFQEPMTSLNPVYTVGKQAAEALMVHNSSIDKKQAKEMVIAMFNMVGIPEPRKRFDVYPHQLSGGLRQRIMIAMALICNSKLLIADEPTTALDVTIEAQILNLMKNLRDKINTSIIMITHNLGVVAEICDDIYVMYTGKIVEHSNVFNIFDNPLHPYTSGLLKSIPKSSDEGKRDKLYSIEGMVPNLLSLPKGCKFCPRCPYAMEICKEEEPELFEAEPNHFVRCFKYK